jgi:hypothetical protein
VTDLLLEREPFDPRCSAGGAAGRTHNHESGEGRAEDHRASVLPAMKIGAPLLAVAELAGFGAWAAAIDSAARSGS